MAKDDQQRANAALNAMRTDLLAAMSSRFGGKYAGSFRRRIGSWRIIFALNPNIQLIEIQAILRRTSTTY